MDSYSIHKSKKKKVINYPNYYSLIKKEIIFQYISYIIKYSNYFRKMKIFKFDPEIWNVNFSYMIF